MWRALCRYGRSVIPEIQICTIAASTALALPTDERAALVLRLAESLDERGPQRSQLA